MEATERNFGLVNWIIKRLVEENCTVKDATEILAYTSREIVANSKVSASEIILKED